MDRGAWQAMVHGVTESDMTGRLSSSRGSVSVASWTLRGAQMERKSSGMLVFPEPALL